MQSKDQLRRVMRGKRKSLAFQTVASRSQLIIKNLSALKEVKSATVFFICVSTDNEVMTHAFIKKLLGTGKIVTTPKILSAGKMMACRVTDWQQLKPGYFGVLEPTSAAPYKGKIEVCVLPSLAVTRQGHRLGRGKGYYDRFLKNHPEMLVLAPVYNFQVIDSIPLELTDRLVDIIITEEEIIRCQH